MTVLRQGVLDDLGVSKGAGSEAVLQGAIRKAALRFVPLLTIAYLFNYLDRTSLGFAALTMNQQLGLSAGQFGFAAGIFFLSYSVFEVPSGLMLYRFGARRWLARIMITWGFASAASAFVVGPNSFYAVRFVLGIAEAGFFPGVLVSLPCIPLGFLTLRLLADRPEVAAWLTRDECAALQQVLAGEVRERPRSSLLAALRDTRVLILAAIQFGFTLASYGIGIWLPLILKEYHLSTWAIGWISAIPYLFASVGMIMWARYVDQSGQRIFNMAVACFLAAAGLVAPIISGSLTVALVGFSVALIGVSAARAIFWTIPTRFLTGVAAAGGLAFINSIGTVGGFAGPSMMGWLREFSGSYVFGLTAVAAIMIAATLASISLRFVVLKE
jgi:ACS family tartrate transporter-like MFS transporter